METRKVQLTGSSTYTISLPKDWAAEQGIEPGQRLALCPRESGALVVGADRIGDAPAPAVEIGDTSPEEIRRTVRALYTLGYDEFGLRDPEGLSTETRRAIADVTSDLTGLEIAVEDEIEVRCRDLLDTSGVSLERVVSRLQFVALSAYREASSALLEPDEKRLNGVERNRRAATAEFAVVERYFQRTLTDVGELDRLGVGRQVVLDYLRVAEQLDRIGRLATELAALVESERPAEFRGEGGAERLDPPANWAEAFSERSQQTRLLIESATSAALSDVAPADARAIRREYGNCLDGIRSLRAVDGAAESRACLLGVDNLERAADCGWRIGERAYQAALRRSE